MSSERGRLIVISGPSASGKSTLWHRLVQDPGRSFSVSATTRSPRAGERDGRDYHFLDDERFLALIEEGAFLEHAEVHGMRYGTLRSEVERLLDEGKDVILEIDVQGAGQVRASGLPVTSVFVMPPSLEVLRQRLRDRGTESEEQMERRLSVAAREVARASEYDHVVINDELERMVAEVEELLAREAAG